MEVFKDTGDVVVVVVDVAAAVVNAVLNFFDWILKNWQKAVVVIETLSCDHEMGKFVACEKY